MASLSRTLRLGRRALMKSCRASAGASRRRWPAGDSLGGLSARQLSSSPVARRGDGGGVTGEHFRLNVDTINPFLLEMQYAVRGAVLMKAMEIEEELKQGKGNYPFKNIIYCNIGDVQGMGNPPITYIRQLITVCLSPKKYLDPEHRWDVRGRMKEILTAMGEMPADLREGMMGVVDGMTPEAEERVREIVDDVSDDVKVRADELLSDMQGRSVGTYTNSQGVAVIRRRIADFITKRDGTATPSNPNNIYLLNGVTDGIKAIMFACVDPREACGVVIPIPQYPIYTASITEFGAKAIEYYLNEKQDWAVDVADMRKRVQSARRHCQPRILVVVNPGNPTGQCLSEDNMREIVKLCEDEGLFLLADEVYMHNIYDSSLHFTSFRKMILEMGSDVQLVSFNSISKGFTGECGIRGGYMELLNLDKEVLEQIYKLFSTKLCPNTMGQVATYAMVHPPPEGSAAYELFKKEKAAALHALGRKADMVYKRFNSIPGVTCNRVRGSMYAFPKIDIPPKAQEVAKSRGEAPDAYYCMEFLEQQGVCVVPGSGFGQEEGTWHFRTTILPTEKDLADMLDRFEKFHLQFVKDHSS